MKKIISEFKEFAIKGNMIDLAVGVVVGGAFGAIVTSLVNDIINPFISLLTGKLDFSNRFIALSDKHFNTIAEAKADRIPTINYGLFINNIINFLIVAFVIFLVIKQINKLKRQPAEATPTTQVCPFCQTSISIKATRCPACTSTIEK